MRRALTVGAPFLTRFAKALSGLDRTVRPFAHIAQSLSSSRVAKKTICCGFQIQIPDPTRHGPGSCVIEIYDFHAETGGKPFVFRFLSFVKMFIVRPLTV